MKNIIYTIILVTLLTANNSDPITSLYDYSAISIAGDTISMEAYRGKKILIVNVASKCGFTSQYIDMQNLHEKYNEHLAVLGFPSNNFFRQEPGSNEEIKNFCQKEYGATFPMIAKINVKGKKQHPIYEWLSNKKLNGWNNKAPSWNFYKYLIDEKWKLIQYFRSNISPLDTIITNHIHLVTPNQE